MAKQAYHIPHPLDASWLDFEIALRSDSGVGFKPIPIKFVLAVIASGLGCLWCVLNTPLMDAGVGLIVVFILLWIALSVLLLKPEKTGGMSFERIPVVLDYIPKSNRYVTTRLDSNANPFYRISNIESIDEDRGLIEFVDGTVGFAFRVVGSGSVLLFDEDREAILNRVDAFYRNMKTDYELIFITSREAQNVRSQLEAIDRRLSRLGGRPGDDEIIALLQTERAYLRDYVGGAFRSIHQYMIIKAESEELLQVGFNMIQSEVENSTLMIKRCTLLYDDELHDLLASVYRGKESV